MSRFTISLVIILSSLCSKSLAFTPVVNSASSQRTPTSRQPRTCLSAVAAPSKVFKDKLETKEKQSSEDHRSLQDEKNFNEWWELRLYDDNVNYDYYVAECLVKTTGLSELQAFRAMKAADVAGEACLGTFAFEQAEWCKEALTAKGLVVDVFPLDL